MTYLSGQHLPRQHHLSKYGKYLDIKYILFPAQALCPIKGSIMLLQGGNTLLNKVKNGIASDNRQNNVYVQSAQKMLIFWGGVVL